MTTICLADPVSDTGTYHYRVALPYKHLREPLRRRGISLVRGDQPACDVYVYSQTITAAGITQAIHLRKLGKRFVLGYDDHPWVMAEGYPNPKQWQLWRDWRRRQLAEVADAVVVTTEPLKAALGGRWARDAVVLPNLIDPDDYQVLPFQRDEGVVNVVFAGSPSHLHDVKILTPAITAAAAEFPQTVFSFLGCKPPQKLHEAFEQYGWLHRLKWYPWVKTANYPQALCALQPDIGLCPLIDNEFTRCKSGIKFLEMTLAGAACVTSRSAVYPEHDFVSCKASNDPALWPSWEQQLRNVLKCPASAADMKTTAHAWVLNNASWARWPDGWRAPAAQAWEDFFVGLSNQGAS